MTQPPKEELKPKKPRRLTLKQQIFIKEYVTPKDPKDIGNGTKAIAKAYPALKNNDVQRSYATENLSKPNIRQEIIAAFNAAGLGTNRIAQRIAHWTESNKHDASLRAMTLWGKWNGLEQPSQVNVQVNVQEAERSTLEKFEGLDIT